MEPEPVRRLSRTDMILLFAFLLNIFNAAVTVYGITHFGAIEMNPLMAEALSKGIAYFVAVKLIVMGLGCWLLSRRHKKRPLRTTVIALFLASLFMLVCAWNVVGIATVLVSR